MNAAKDSPRTAPTVREKLAAGGSRGAVVSQHRRASEVGAEILRAGGNAVDAALATAFALAVLEPWMSGIGGGGYMLIGRNGEPPSLVDFNLRAPARVRAADYPVVEGMSNDLFPWPAVEGERNTRGPLSVCAPTMVAGMELAWRTFGKLPWRTLLEPSIELAKDGLLVDWYTQLVLSSLAKDMRHEPAARAMFLDEGGASLTTGWTALSPRRLSLGALAETLIVLAGEGSDAIVRGDVGRTLVEDVKARGGVLEMEDFTASAPRTREPVCASYRGSRIWTTAGLSGGTTLAQILRALEGAGMPTGLRGDFYAALVDTMAPILRARLKEMGDRGAGGNDRSCTTHFCTADSEGLAVSATITLVSMFGSKVLSPRTGVMLNNGMSWFDPAPGGANSIGPAKFCLNNMAPALMHEPGSRGLVAVGAAGGRKIIPAVAQLITFMIDGGLSLEAACRHPRLDVHHDRTIVADDRMDEEILSLLGSKGRLHRVAATVYPHHFGIVEALKLTDGFVEAVPDAMAPLAGAVNA